MMEPRGTVKVEGAAVSEVRVARRECGMNTRLRLAEDRPSAGNRRRYSK